MRLRLANAHDEPALRALIRRDAMPGSVRLVYGREPDFFFALALQGREHQVIVAEEHGEIIGMGCRSLREVFYNGAPLRLGYLSGLRALAPARGGTGLARGYRFLRELHAAQPVPAYLTTIMEDNRAAQALLESGRAGLPRYRPIGRLTTYAIAVRRCRPAPVAHGLTVTTAAQFGRAETLRWLNEAGAQRQFFPVFRETDFDTPLLRGLNLSNFFIALRDGQPVGSLAAWDQSACKQFHVAGYAPWLAVARPLLNRILRWRGAQPLPPPGQTLSVCFGAWWLVTLESAEVARALLDRVLAVAAEAGNGFCVVSCVDADPLAAVARQHQPLALHSRVYLVDWESGPGLADQLDGRPLFMEAAVL